MRHRLAPLFVFSVFAAGSAFASSARNHSVTVTATVVPYVASTIDGQPAKFTVTDIDVRRGYIDMTGPSVDVRTNDPHGYLVSFDLETSSVDSVRVAGLSQEVVFGHAGGFVVEPRALSTTLNYRFFLGVTAAAGEYTWPVAVKIRRARR